MTPSTRALRLVAVAASLQSVAVTGCAATVRAAADGLERVRATVPGDPARVCAVIETAAWAGLALAFAWIALAVIACARDLARHPSRPLPRAALGCLRPAFVRSLLAVLVGGCVVTPGPALAPTDATPDGWAVLDGLPLPSLPLGGAPHGRTRVTHRQTTVLVRPGDSLWALTRDLLGPRATDADVARAWPRLHVANLAPRGALGPDPDLVLPGTTLRVPAGLVHRPDQPDQPDPHSGDAR